MARSGAASWASSPGSHTTTATLDSVTESVLATFITDSMGFFIFLGLATVFLL